MAKFYFYYAAMNAGKSTNLLQSAHNYEERYMKTIIFTPKLDDRYGVGKVASRIGLDREAEIFEGEDDLYVWTAHEHQREKLSCVLVDEAQFLSPKQVLQLTLIVDKLKIPVLCYGLRTDFRGEPFPGSVYLMAWADELVELKTICKSGKKATFNARLDEDGNRVTEGDQVSIGLNYEAQARDIFELDKVSPIDYKIPEAN
ncbi:MAG: thymidine kinase [Actinobacteria bacterium]|jgi:thymidine kinase|nr:thymidine kinase [Actinomycetota bacterium]MDA9592404.1 thymidine kinase [Candidatus Actinomarina sp.]MDA9674017.1 thymidine kinase [bacterium]MBT3873544.1 thymidine kinase [Actinomycetota bacterium]MBT5656108.1 thymidine kinase [Actinomycetota bacterium]|tara:strand:+ start:2099 stop:2701 length:603 start_codon:yes stop_codon:yes gene_type:complete